MGLRRPSILGKKRTNVRPHFATARTCPACELKKEATAFRTSNKDPRLRIICWQCRHDDPRIESQFFATPSLRKRKVLSRSSRNATFRKRFFALRQILKGKEVRELAVKYDAMKIMRLPDRVAAIVGKTFAVMGDDAKLSDDEALTRIRDLLEEVDETIIERNKNKRLSRIS